MHSETSKQRWIQNEQIIREKNTSVGKSLKKYFRNDPALKHAPIAFVCECSDLDCKELINASIDNYQKFHKRRDRFTVSRGHVTPAVERVVAQEGDFDIVEKFALSS